MINNEIIIQAISALEFLKILKNINIGFDDKGKLNNLKNIFEMGYGSNSIKNLFSVKDVTFYSKDNNVLSLFQGYPYDIDEVKKYSELINPFLNHIFEVICDKNNELYIYVISWISFLIQNPVRKTETALIIIGEQGTGKNKFFTDVISKLFGRYCISKENNISNIIGRFNSIIENKILIICNELQNIDNAKLLDTSGLKSLISDNEINIESKYINTRKIQNVSNFIFVSNNLLPINIECSDRRYIVYKISNSYKNNSEYLNNLNNLFNTDLFYNNLFLFFKNYDISKYNSRIILIIEMKTQMIDACKESWQLFFEDNIFRFKNKYNSPTAYLDYCNY
jgi:hypothetical protein